MLIKLKPGLHLDVPAAEYHSDPCETPSLSSSIAKVMLEQTPAHAWLKHPRLNPRFTPSHDEKFDLGSVVHELMLGRGGGIEIIDGADYRTKDARQRRDDARLAGLTPILSHQYHEAQQISEAATKALKEIHGCESFFHAGAKSEAVIVWQDIGGPLCRAMLDRWSVPDVYDVKTTAAGLSDAAIARTIVNFGYDISAAFYLRGLTKLDPNETHFLWVFVEIEPPYEVRVVKCDATTLAMGDRKAATAIEKWRRCMESGQWPGYLRKIGRVDYPSWAEAQWLERELVDPDFANSVLSNTVTSR